MPVAQDLTKLANAGDVIVVRNTQPGITIFEDPDNGVSARWEAAGDLNGEDVREMSAIALKSPDFRSTLLRGILVIEDAPEVLAEAVALSVAQWQSRQQTQADSKAAILRASDRSIAKGKTCIAPKGRDLCNSIAVVSENRPPLCTEHVLLVNQYSKVEGSDGTPTWKRKA